MVTRSTTFVLEPTGTNLLPRLLNANDRLHYRVKGPATKAWRTLSELAALDAAADRIYDTVRIVVAIRFPTAHRRDVGNFYPTAKAIVDGIVDAGVLPDDSDEYVTGPDLRRDRPNGPLRLTVTITERISR